MNLLRRSPVLVAQIFNLPYRRIVFCQAIERNGWAGFRERLAD
jgi:hypothetical protein